MPDRLMTIPFCGFYHSWLSDAVDATEESEVEYWQERQAEDGTPPELRVSDDIYADALMDATDYSAIYKTLARDYADSFNVYMSEALGFPLGLQFESMDSPREYNFTTDRVFVHVGHATVEALFKLSEADGHKALAEVIAARHTSRSGFASHYSNDLGAWLDKPLARWDHNELETLLLAAFQASENYSDDLVYEVCEMVCEDDGVYIAWSQEVDWEAVDRKVEDARDELRAQLDPAYVPAMRCRATPDMLTGRA